MPRVDLDEYELSERLGSGTVGTIFLATKSGDDQSYAVKFLSPAASGNELIVSRFHREMMILEKLNHPNILAYYGGGKQHDQLFYLMEFIRGGTLKDLQQKSGTLSWREAAESGRQIAAALQHAHNHGIIHRDLKPGNVFVTESGDLKLGDFGIARDTQMHDLTEAGLTVGTYSYMAPELVRGERGITGHVDLYALGCLLYALLVGDPPYLGDNFAQIFDQHLNSTPPSVRQLGIDCPEKMDELIQQLLAKQPQDRPFNARTVQGILGHLLDPANKAAADEGDRNAGDIVPAKELLSTRVMSPAVSRDVSWMKLTIFVMGIVIIVLGAMLLNR